MPVGVILNCLAVAVGGIFGAALGEKMPDRLKQQLTMIFGLCAVGMGAVSLIQLKNLPVVIFSLIAGTAAGLLLHLEDRVQAGLGRLQKPLGKLLKTGNSPEEQAVCMSSLITVLVLFGASANGIFGCLDAGFSGDHTVLISKSIMDLFTAMIFACSLGAAVTLISIPQFAIFLAFFALAKVIYPLASPEMISDFKGCGGLLLVATGFRIMKIREFPLVDMIPAMLLSMPISYIWTNCIAPLL